MKQQSSNLTQRAGKHRLALGVLGAFSLIAVAFLLIFPLVFGNTEVSAKSQNSANNKDLVKTLKIVSVDHPSSFKGVGRYPTIEQKGQQLVAVTVDFARDYQQHLQASGAGEVYLTTDTQNVTYYTVDTAIPQGNGPGKKPVTQATFVFSVPLGTGPLTLHYDQYSAPLPKN